MSARLITLLSHISHLISQIYFQQIGINLFSANFTGTLWIWVKPSSVLMMAERSIPRLDNADIKAVLKAVLLAPQLDFTKSLFNTTNSLVE